MDRHKIFEGNARRVYPRLDAHLKARGKLGEGAGFSSSGGGTRVEAVIG